MGYAGSGDRVIRAARQSDMNILESLKSGPKSYRELIGNTSPVVFDIQLAGLLKSKAVVLALDFSGETARFSLPQTPREDEELPPSRKVLALSKPRKNQYCFDKEGRKKCAVCGKRRGRTRFMYGGRTWGTCFECSKEKEQT